MECEQLAKMKRQRDDARRVADQGALAVAELREVCMDAHLWLDGILSHAKAQDAGTDGCPPNSALYNLLLGTQPPRIGVWTLKVKAEKYAYVKVGKWYD